MARHGRDPDAVRVLPGLAPIVAGTEAEARALEQQLEQLTIPEYGLDQLGDLLGVDIGDVDLDAPLPARLRPSAGSHIKSRFELVQRIVDREPEITLRRLLLRLSGGRGHRVVAGAPEQIADTIEEWFRAGAADGFNLIPPALPSSLRAFVDGVVPELQRRGLFRTEYEGTTLREHLGLPRPASPHAAARSEPVAV